MRTWRVGTISMGLSLIGLGAVLFYATVFGEVSPYHLLLSWWPLLLIILGVEMIVFFILNKKDAQRITYDFLSMIFVGILGTVALSFMFLSFSGIAEEIKHGIRSTSYSYELPAFDAEGEIERVVIQIEDGPLTIEASEQAQVRVFGTYQSDQEIMPLQQPEDYLVSYQDEQVLYLIVKALPQQTGWHTTQMSMEPTFMIPENVDLEVRSKNYSTISLYPRNLSANWAVLGGAVKAYIDDEGDYTVEAAQIRVHENGDERLETTTVGQGSYGIFVTATDDVTVYNIP